MDYLSPTSRKRLPAAIQKLSDKEQAVFVMLRMRRDESRISRELKVSPDDARRMIKNVQDALVKSGRVDLIQNPVFFPIDQPGAAGSDENVRAFDPPSGDMDVADRIALDQFYTVLKSSLEQMPKDGRRLLGLWFNDEMKAKDILIFYKNIGVPISSEKSIHETTEQDVFYALEKNIRNLLEIVRSNMKDKQPGLTPSVLRAVLNETGV